jgi:tripartite-type tricarboxylate transporter receptor subunit TctC
MRLHDESIKLLKQPDVKERLDTAGFELIGNSPEQFATFIRSEIAKWAKVIKASGARAE